MISQAAFHQMIGRAAQQQRARPPNVTTLPAPIRGLNGRDDIEDMRPEDAIALDNFFPGFGRVKVRGGSEVFATLSGESNSNVESVFEFHSGATRKLLAAAGGEIWDVTAGGTINSALTSSSFTSDRWQHAMMNDKLLLVNGSDAPQEYDGSSVSAMTIDEKSGEPALDVSDLAGVHVFKGRAYYWTGADQDFWYSALNAHAGDLELFPLGDQGSFGGHLLFMTTLTRDGGDGVDDYAVFVMSSGEVIIYQGSDPGSASAWAHVGTARIGEPVGNRAYAKVGGDVLIATQDGYSLLSKVISGVRGASGLNIDDRLGAIALKAAREQGGNFGWDILHYPNGRYLLVNHPTSGKFEQHVVNIATGAWCRFRGMNARSWVLYDSEPYFGASGGKIWQANTGTKDDGATVVAVGQSAFSYLGRRGRNKLVTLVRPLLASGAEIDTRIGISVDFDPGLARRVDATIGVAAAGGTKWDSAKWDTFKWGTKAQTVQAWIGHNARGYSISPELRVEQEDSPISWSAISLMHVPAGEI